MSSYLAANHSGTVSVLEFNPWLYSGQIDLSHAFFNLLADELSLSGRLAQGLSNYLLARPAPLAALPVTGHAAVQVTSHTQVGHRALTVDERETLGGLLAARSKTIVVLVDDIDRLERDDLLLVFKLVRMNANLPKIVYLLAFDDDVAANAISLTRGEYGQSFLEKIVQFPLSLPTVGHTRLLQYVEKHARRALSLAEISLTEPEWKEFSALNKLLAEKLTTPRQATRFGAALEFALPMLVGEVDPLQQMAVEGLRILYPSSYAKVRQNIGKGQLERLDLDAERGASSLFSYLLNRHRNGAPIRGAFSNPLFTERYFEYSIRESDISLWTFDQLLSFMNRGDDAASLRLRELYTHNPTRLLDYIQERIDFLTIDQSTNLALALGHIAGSAFATEGVTTDEQTAQVDGLTEVILRLVYGNIIRPGAAELESRARFELISKILTSTQGLGFKVKLLGRYLARHHSQRDEEAELTPDDIGMALREKLVQIANEAASNLFSNQPGEQEFLDLWRSEDIFGFREWFTNLVRSNSRVAFALLKTFHSPAEVHFHLHSWCETEVFHAALRNELQIPETRSPMERHIARLAQEVLVYQPVHEHRLWNTSDTPAKS